MWILNFLPDAVFHTLLIAGFLGLIAGFVFGFIPIINVYKLPIQVVSVLVFCLALWYEGGIAKDKEWQAKVKELNDKLLIAQANSGIVTTEVVTKYVTKNKIIKEKGDTITEYIDREIVKLDATCPIPEVVIKSHNAAALNKPELLVPLTMTTEISPVEHDKLAKPALKLAPRK
jgi:hypothetical protein